jgi:hypothetical protein
VVVVEAVDSLDSIRSSGQEDLVVGSGIGGMVDEDRDDSLVGYNSCLVVDIVDLEDNGLVGNVAVEGTGVIEVEVPCQGNELDGHHIHCFRSKAAEADDSL